MEKDGNCPKVTWRGSIKDYCWTQSCLLLDPVPHTYALQEITEKWVVLYFHRSCTHSQKVGTSVRKGEAIGPCRGHRLEGVLNERSQLHSSDQQLLGMCKVWGLQWNTAPRGGATTSVLAEVIGRGTTIHSFIHSLAHSFIHSVLQARYQALEASSSQASCGLG